MAIPDFNDPLFRRIFFEVHSRLPREGPGDESSLRRALGLVSGLPSRPRVLDVGCGPGRQTADLARLTGGLVIGLDNHLPFVGELARRSARHGPNARLRAVAGDMNHLPFPFGSFDLIWSEGAAYQMGFQNALNAWRNFLKPRGWLAATEAVWLKPGAPQEVKRCWEEYPDLAGIGSVLRQVSRCGYKLAGHFTLPEEAWWKHYYRPMEKRLIRLRRKYRSNPRVLEMLAHHQMEIDIYRRYSEYYGYEFVVGRRTE